tara:strand:- start:153 stop:374 length:222 start_codon:yes stop_codon:yes gene_type:complete
MNNDNKKIVIDDRAYRRGYRHGYSQALQEIKWGKKVGKLYSWSNELDKWNFMHDPQAMTPPPVYPEKFKGDKK